MREKKRTRGWEGEEDRLQGLAVLLSSTVRFPASGLLSFSSSHQEPTVEDGVLLGFAAFVSRQADGAAGAAGAAGRQRG